MDAKARTQWRLRFVQHVCYWLKHATHARAEIISREGLPKAKSCSARSRIRDAYFGRPKRRARSITPTEDGPFPASPALSPRTPYTPQRQGYSERPALLMCRPLPSARGIRPGAGIKVRARLIPRAPVCIRESRKLSLCATGRRERSRHYRPPFFSGDRTMGCCRTS